MSYENILLEKKGQISLLTINRPKQLNALNKQTISELSKALDEVVEDAEVRVLIITGSGDKAFVAGADIKEFSNYGVGEGTDLAAEGQAELFDKIENFDRPVIAAINGFALGGGLELAMACHMRVASYKAKLGLPETGLGLIPGYGGTQRLPRLIGQGRAIEMITTAQMIEADKAEDIGLVNHAVAPADLLDTAEKIANAICKNSPMAVSSAIRSVNAGFRTGVDGFKIEIEEFGKRFGTEDFKEGTSAFLEKRKPEF